MAGKFKQGLYKPKNPKKYIGDLSKVVYRSSWEHKLCRKFDDSSNVIGWCMEENVIPYISPVDGRMHRYFMDFMVVTKDKRVILIEVKPFAQTQPPKTRNKERLLYETKTYLVNQAKWKAAEQYCKEKGWVFKVVTEKDLNFM
jgi:hypothetical protein